MSNNYHLAEGYISRTSPAYFIDQLDIQRNVTHQPHVYPLAARLGKAYGCTHIIDIGCGQARKLLEYQSEFELIGVDMGANIEYCQANYSVGQWIELDLDDPDSRLNIDPDIVSSAVIVCADVIEHLVNPELLLKHLHQLLEHAPVALLTTPDRDAKYGEIHLGPPDNSHHVREWNLDELVTFVEANDIKVEFAGRTMSSDLHWKKATSLLILSHNERPPIQAAPDDFQVVAIMAAYNEADIITPSINYLSEQGIAVYLIDNWSDDSTFEQAEALLGQGVIGLERYPANRLSDGHTFNWEELLKRKVAIARELEADWIIHHDVDEIRESPWPHIALRDVIYHVDQCGFNSIDHTLIDFRPVDNLYTSASDFGAYFRHYTFGERPGHFIRINTWKQTQQAIDLSASGGHHVRFDAQRVYPYKFLLRHYPLRSQAQAAAKIRARQHQSSRHERVRGWHVMYDHLDASDKDLFDDMCDQTRKTHRVFDPEAFYVDNLVERLSGIGLTIKQKSLLTRIRNKLVGILNKYLQMGFSRINRGN